MPRLLQVLDEQLPDPAHDFRRRPDRHTRGGDQAARAAATAGDLWPDLDPEKIEEIPVLSQRHDEMGS